jgi:hypothetical protein
MIYELDALKCMYRYMFKYFADPMPLWLRKALNTNGPAPNSPADILIRYGVFKLRIGYKKRI